MDILLRTIDNEKTEKNDSRGDVRFFVLCLLSKYTLLFDLGKDHAKIIYKICQQNITAIIQYKAII